ncbi:MAG: EMC3/TMCO1 family protein [Candidatus Nanoarchaeia archaeon]|nr:EMC3/TMCO1 family protein [Candidatus Nanoarchaeia archaeon]MDD5239647.1 EMC3/TMCO1 family protein [Candidatus Nanoarchaeia archaeon]
MDMLLIWLVLLASGLSLMTQIVNKLTINEKKADQYREEMKKMQNELKTMDPKSAEFTKKQDEMLDKNMWIMKQQFKPMMFTLLPYLIVFYFVTPIFAYNAIAIGSQVTVSVTGTGDVFSDCLGIDTAVSGSFKNITTVSSENCTANLGGTEVDLNLIGSGNINTFEAGGLKMSVMPPEKEYIKFPISIPFAGKSFGWLGTFIWSSLFASLILTKVLKGRYLRKWE